MRVISIPCIWRSECGNMCQRLDTFAETVFHGHFASLVGQMALGFVWCLVASILCFVLAADPTFAETEISEVPEPQ